MDIATGRKAKTNIRYHLYVKSKKKDTDKFIYKTERDSQTQKTNLWLPKGKGEGSDKLGSWYIIYTIIYKINNQQGPIV